MPRAGACKVCLFFKPYWVKWNTVFLAYWRAVTKGYTWDLECYLRLQSPPIFASVVHEKRAVSCTTALHGEMAQRYTV